MDIINVGLLGLTVWRISYMFVKESGPVNVFQSFREVFGIVHDSDGEILGYPERFIPSLLSCIYCTSVWVSMGVMLFYWLFGSVTIFILSPFWLSAIAIMIDTMHERT